MNFCRRACATSFSRLPATLPAGFSCRLFLEPALLSFHDCPQHEPCVMRQRARPSVMFHHDAETFFQRSAAVAGSHSFVEVIDYGDVRMVQQSGFLHDADAPVYIGREAILQVVRFRQRAFREKGLMANHHSLLETSPCKPLRSRQTTHVPGEAGLTGEHASPLLLQLKVSAEGGRFLLKAVPASGGHS